MSLGTCHQIIPGANAWEQHRCTRDAIRKTLPRGTMGEPHGKIELPFCGQHADMHDRRATKRAEHEKEREEAKARREENDRKNAALDNLARMLSDRWGLSLTACHYPYATKGVVIAPEDAERLFAEGYELREKPKS